MLDRITASRLSKIEYTRELYRHVLERNGKVSKTKRSKLSAKAVELYSFEDDPQIGRLASLIASIAVSVTHWAESHDDRELEFIAQKIKSADAECRRILEGGI